MSIRKEFGLDIPIHLFLRSPVLAARVARCSIRLTTPPPRTQNARAMAVFVRLQVFGLYADTGPQRSSCSLQELGHSHRVLSYSGRDGWGVISDIAP